MQNSFFFGAGTMVTSTIVLNDAAVIDHACIDHNGHVVGGSYHVSVTITGTQNGKEGIDFTYVTRLINQAISGNKGLDHKLWIVNNLSAISAIQHVNAGIPAFVITTPSTSLSIPQDAVCRFERDTTIKCATHHEIITVAAELYAAHLIFQQLTTSGFPVINIVCRLHENFHTAYSKNTLTGLFRYVHGLKDAISFGAQNIVHGHYSFFQLNTAEFAHTTFEQQALVDRIQRDLKRSIFVCRNHIISEDNLGILSIAYKTTRGPFSMVIQKSQYRVHILDCEPTVENLVDFIAKRYEAEFLEHGIVSITVSEGLSRGACKSIIAD